MTTPGDKAELFLTLNAGPGLAGNESLETATA